MVVVRGVDFGVVVLGQKEVSASFTQFFSDLHWNSTQNEATLLLHSPKCGGGGVHGSVCPTTIRLLSNSSCPSRVCSCINSWKLDDAASSMGRSCWAQAHFTSNQLAVHFAPVAFLCNTCFLFLHCLNHNCFNVECCLSMRLICINATVLLFNSEQV